MMKAGGGGRRAADTVTAVTGVAPPEAVSREPGAAQDVRAERLSRRSIVARLAAAFGLAGVGAQAAIVVRSLAPNVSYDAPTVLKIGPPESFADGLTLLPERRVFVVRDGRSFRAVSAVCTHLGCTVRPEMLEEADPADPDRRRQVQTYAFACPCHGSRYRSDGTNLSGPAPRPLASYGLSLAPDDGQLVVDVGREVARTTALTIR
jgi:cytochrome b6-f complex iron-sulfur subunit